MLQVFLLPVQQPIFHMSLNNGDLFDLLLFRDSALEGQFFVTTIATLFLLAAPVFLTMVTMLYLSILYLRS